LSIQISYRFSRPKLLTQRCASLIVIVRVAGSEIRQPIPDERCGTRDGPVPYGVRGADLPASEVGRRFPRVRNGMAAAGRVGPGRRATRPVLRGAVFGAGFPGVGSGVCAGPGGRTRTVRHQARDQRPDFRLARDVLHDGRDDGVAGVSVLYGSRVRARGGLAELAREVRAVPRINAIRGLRVRNRRQAHVHHGRQRLVHCLRLADVRLLSFR